MKKRVLRALARVILGISLFGSGSFGVAAAFADPGMEERDHTYLYDEYTFEFPSSSGGIFRALAYVVAGKEVFEKGLYGVACGVIAHVLEKYKNKDKEEGVDQYLVSIVTYPFPEQHIECVIMEYNLNMKELEELSEFLSKQRRPDISF